MGGEPQRRYYTGVEEIEPSSSSGGNGLVLSFLALVILAGGAYFAYLFFDNPSQNTETGVVANSTPTPLVISTPFPAATPEPSPTPEQSNVLKMELIAGNECWIKIIPDDQEPDQGLLKMGDVREYKASEKIIIVTMGNTPALKIIVNGRQLDPAKLMASPRSLLTRNIILTKDNYQTYVQ
jgi:hypothetical protein